MKDDLKILIAPKRQFRQQVSSNWQQTIAEISGVRVIGTRTASMSIKASIETVREIERLLGEAFHIEQAIEHLPNQDENLTQPSWVL